MNYILALPILPFYVLGRYKGFAIFLLIVVISISPRIHLGTLEYGKLLDIRCEDILIVLLIFSWLLYSVFNRPKFYFSPLGKVMLVYLFLAFISTSAGLLLGWLNPLRAFFFYLKEVEFLLIFFITINFIKNVRNLKIALLAFLIGGLANGFNVLYQFLSGKMGGMEVPGFVYRYYGVSMLGESGPAVTGNYFSLVLVLSIPLFIFVSSKLIRLISVACIFLSILGLVGSMSRTSILGVISVLPLFFYFLVSLKRDKFNKKHALTVLTLLLSAILFFSMMVFTHLKDELPFAGRIADMRKENILQSYYSERVEDVYEDYFRIIPMSPLIGLGKSITGEQSVPGVTVNYFYGEAHNQYLRILAEMGISGLLVFLYLVFLIIKSSYSVFRDKFTYFRTIGLTCLIYTIFSLITSLAQDVFIIARTTELFWILIGLLMVAHSWKQEKLA